MNKEKRAKKPKDALVKSLQQKYGVSLQYSSDAKLYKSLEDSGLPSLSKLLKIVNNKTA